ncbi:cbb3-type cytochrome c oxidase subunit II [Heliophilum fasciatum]|uniref:Cbb3-type cytochrome c oxidase subunit II n=1 Tax=Heliophilum fasciatum TaxID=35700 RepID=A0A4R2RHF3_9FIRM|nr:cbb3-type cytochrome c oxidase subunit II [Heliophilum fasciatum]MCW2278915.1 cytochrome c oxidase cbb3-type subunit 2/cytochrome c oxidase cbb3-type subunit I/II [Heliophilum fasciatum]TCP62048.1 cbb3-type cytochrome c oxidase subunit II [Heliophilum fasciatum]
MERNPYLLVFVAIFFFAVGTVATMFIPFTEENLMTPTPTAEYRKQVVNDNPQSKAAKGRELYMQNGCMYCHTQWVRPTKTDEKLGPVIRAGDTYYDSPHLHGSNRTGPDLLWVGDRIPDKAWHIKHLKDPQSVVAGSIMPPYKFLSDEELDALAEYLVTLKHIDNPTDQSDPQYRY